MHVLFTAVPGHGHVNPLVPLARALQHRGHKVTFVSGTEMRGRIEQLGFPCVDAGPTLEEMKATALADPAVRDSLATEPWRVVAAIFGGRVDPILRDLGDVDLHPDLVVHDVYELAGPLLAARARVPWVSHGLGPRWPAYLETSLEEVVDASWAAQGVVPAPRGGVGRFAYVEICPTAARSDDATTDGRVLESRPVPLEEPPVPLDLPRHGDRPLVYATLGTVTNEDPAAFRALLDACAGIDADVVLTIGGRLQPVDLGARPPNVTVRSYVPHAQLLDACDLVLCHGGSGTMLAACGAGVPTVVVPQGTDQHRNAPFWERTGATRVVATGDLGPEVLADALDQARPGGPLHRAAQALAAEIAAMPDVDRTAAVLEELAEGQADREPAG